MQRLTGVEYSLFDAVLSAVPKLPRFDFVIRTFLFSEHQHDHALQVQQNNSSDKCDSFYARGNTRSLQ